MSSNTLRPANSIRGASLLMLPLTINYIILVGLLDICRASSTTRLHLIIFLSSLSL